MSVLLLLLAFSCESARPGPFQTCLNQDELQFDGKTEYAIKVARKKQWVLQNIMSNRFSPAKPDFAREGYYVSIGPSRKDGESPLDLVEHQANWTKFTLKESNNRGKFTISPKNSANQNFLTTKKRWFDGNGVYILAGTDYRSKDENKEFEYNFEKHELRHQDRAVTMYPTERNITGLYKNSYVYDWGSKYMYVCFQLPMDLLSVEERTLRKVLTGKDGLVDCLGDAKLKEKCDRETIESLKETLKQQNMQSPKGALNEELPTPPATEALKEEDTTELPKETLNDDPKKREHMEKEIQILIYKTEKKPEEIKKKVPTLEPEQVDPKKNKSSSAVAFAIIPAFISIFFTN